MCPPYLLDTDYFEVGAPPPPPTSTFLSLDGMGLVPGPSRKTSFVGDLTVDYLLEMELRRPRGPDEKVQVNNRDFKLMEVPGLSDGPGEETSR